ncbi:PcfJ domain-containing protein [Flavobacterium sp. CSZ]|uniref:PcfJ domain-containing protein n=1 Tax=Flavobacterium sp. CSZ TaxID=2783791 RepID=UPI001889D893|nr:PcfJ domain-containing protein [Flavobacterium sp. CSZ]MBF4484411.1 PcfJ domain-containing protein [Flavobacterium sp. CSZ]
MKPKTRLQVEVLHLHNTCLSPAKQHENYLISKFEFFYTTHYKNFICLECNQMWKPKMDKWKEEIVGVECPSCSKKLKYIKTGSKGQVSRFVVGSIVEVVGRFQVFRYVSLWKYMDKSKKPDYSLDPLFEEWIDYDKDKSTIVGRCTGPFRDGFTCTDYEIRYVNKNAYWSRDNYFHYESDYICPGAEYLPRFHYYKLDNKALEADPRTLLRKLKNNSQFETIFKLENKELLKHALKEDSYSRYFNQIKIALRHKYVIKDPGIWFDYVSLLKSLNKDINNPTLILPRNLKKSHNEYVAIRRRKNEIERKRREEENRIRQFEIQEEQRKRADAEEILRGIKEKAFQDFKFKSGKIEIVALLKEEDVKLEGEILDHCVYENEYHKKNGILLMSARIKGERLETIEISLASFSIIQSRGYDNEPTAYHDEIIAIVRQNMGKISRLVEKQKKLKGLDLSVNKLQVEAA